MVAPGPGNVYLLGAVCCIMDGFWDGMMGGYPYGMYPWMFPWVAISWVIQLIVGYFVYRDARDLRMNAALWLILVILPMIGWLFLVVYVIVRESELPSAARREQSAADILDERYAKGEISHEQYRQMKEELRK